MLTLILITFTALLSWAAFKRSALLARLIFWPPAIARDKQYERLLTHGFIHLDFMHLLFNMMTLFIFGPPLEKVFAARFGDAGGWLYLLFYCSAIVVAIIPTYLKHKDDANYHSLGASGAVSAVLFGFILMQPWAKMIIIPIPFRIPAIVYALLYVGYSIWMGRRGADNINHTAHLAGAAYGVLFMLVAMPDLGAHFLGQLGL